MFVGKRALSALCRPCMSSLFSFRPPTAALLTEAPTASSVSPASGSGHLLDQTINGQALPPPFFFSLKTQRKTSLHLPDPPAE
ncbi:hypothetical protein NPIL_45481 [Nephila pilipes]|uniref:Uncharacterized protein n=1 Tax=Nephila pilipes TaxID=299642 RepID=A0A8X6P069_NEPPI|nr:hypothetical protein NPIL_45481 [Nephila pilipes]